MADIFPITEPEADALHSLGWRSGFGWKNSFDWFYEPSFGPPIHLEDDAEMMARWQSDLESIRQEAADKLLRERVAASAPELVEAPACMT